MSGVDLSSAQLRQQQLSSAQLRQQQFMPDFVGMYKSDSYWISEADDAYCGHGWCTCTAITYAHTSVAVVEKALSQALNTLAQSQSSRRF
jgi:hypothetical protein